MNFIPFSMDPDDLPEPLRSMMGGAMSAIQSGADRAEVSAEVAQNEVFQFFMDLSPEHLAFIGQLFSLVGDSRKGPQILSQFVGQIDSIMRLQYPNLCRHCGRNQCKNSAPTAEDKPETVTPGGIVIPSGEEQRRIEEQASLARKAAMEEYGIVEVVGGGLACSGCGMVVNSLEDRMLRAPREAGCIGCQHKSAHG